MSDTPIQTYEPGHAGMYTISGGNGTYVKRADHLKELEGLRALMELACADIIFFHEQDHPFVGPETPELPAKVAFSVMVNDLFVPAADAEGFDISEAIPLRDIFRKDGYEGFVRWVQAKRDNMPLRPNVEKRVKEKEDLRAQLRSKDEQLAGMRQSLQDAGERENKWASDCDRAENWLREAAQSLRTIATKAGIDEYMKDAWDVRGYANSRANVAEAALSGPSPAQEGKP